jgi:hypothetical protein
MRAGTSRPGGHRVGPRGTVRCLNTADPERGKYRLGGGWVRTLETVCCGAAIAACAVGAYWLGRRGAAPSVTGSSPSFIGPTRTMPPLRVPSAAYPDTGPTPAPGTDRVRPSSRPRAAPSRSAASHGEAKRKGPSAGPAAARSSTTAGQGNPPKVREPEAPAPNLPQVAPHLEPGTTVGTPTPPAADSPEPQATPPDGPVVEAQDAPAAAKRPGRRKAVQCSGVTRRGERCRRKTLDSTGLCYQHREP